MTSQWVERTWIRTGGYGRFRGEWVKRRDGRHSFSISLNFYQAIPQSSPQTRFMFDIKKLYTVLKFIPGETVQHVENCDRLTRIPSKVVFTILLQVDVKR